MHPLVTDLSDLKDNELESKIGDLTRKYFITHNVGVKAQIASVLESYREESNRRKAIAYEKMIESRDKGLDKLINVN